MYKVFFNDSTILIGSEMKKSLNDNITRMFDFCDNSVVSQIVNEIEVSKLPLKFCISGDVCSQTWNCFRDCFTEIPAAGGLIRNKEDQILFIKRLGYWDLPKGKIEKNETAEDASVREVEEECGISGLNVIRQLDSTFHIYRSPYLSVRKNLVLKETKWFLMEYAENQTPIPQTEENIVEIKWFASQDVAQVYSNTYSSLHDFLEKTLTII